MLLKLLIYLEDNWENICKTRRERNAFDAEKPVVDVYFLKRIFNK